MLMFHLAYALYLISLAGGLTLLIWALRAEGKGRGIAKFFGTVIILLSLLGAFFIGYSGIRYWHVGYFTEPMIMHPM